MPIEIERKFLVQGLAWRTGQPIHFSQGYLNRDADRTVRVRLADQKGFLTVKGRTVGASRIEFEYEIASDDARQLLEICLEPLVEKRRYLVPFAGNQWEVDEFLGENKGLVIAEIELDSEHQSFEKPDWLGVEVTHDPRYYNSRLSELPFSQWGKPG